MNNRNSRLDENKQNLTILDLNIIWSSVKARKLLIGVTVLAGLLVVSAINILIKPIYVKGALISLPVYKKPIIHQDEIKAVIRDINAMIERNAQDILIKKEVFSAEDLDGVISISCPIAKAQEGVFTIVVKSKREENIPNIIRDAVRYLNSHEIISDRINKRKSLLNKKVELSQKAVNNAEALRTIFLDLIKKGDPIDLSFNIIQIDQTIRNMKLELENIQKEMALFKGFEIISRLDAPPKRKGINFIRSLFIGLVISLFLGILIAVFSSWRRATL